MAKAKLRIFDKDIEHIALDLLDDNLRFAGVTVVLDQDFLPGVALMFGWAPCHPGTDGTVDCSECGLTAN